MDLMTRSAALSPNSTLESPLKVFGKPVNWRHLWGVEQISRIQKCESLDGFVLGGKR